MYRSIRFFARTACIWFVCSTVHAAWSPTATLASSQKAINQTLITLIKKLPEPVAYIFAKKYIAGSGLEDAVIAVKKLNALGIAATLDVLGEAVTNKEESVRAKQRYLDTLDAINRNNLDSNISIKPTHFGLTIDPEFCYQQISELLTRAQQYHNFVRIDMENSATTDATIALYKRLHQTFNNVGIVAQANLKRTLPEIQSPELKDTNYRLCKGVYKESGAIAFNDITLIRQNFVTIAKYLFEHGNYAAIATQDDALVAQIYQLITDTHVAQNKFEFQTLYGVREDLRDKINRDGYKVRVYVPFGTHWYPYAMRRLQESANVAWLVISSLLGK